MSLKYSEYKNQSPEAKEAWKYLLTHLESIIHRVNYTIVIARIRDAIDEINDVSYLDSRVINVVKDQLSLNEVDVTKSLHSLGADSLDYIEIIMAIEDELKIEIRDDLAQKLNNSEATVQQLIDMVKSIH